MRIRTLVGAVVVAAGLSATLTGAAGAVPAHDDPPPEADVLLVTCEEDGRVTTRPLTEEERERIEDVRGRVERGEIEPAEAGRVIHEDGGNVVVFRGEVPDDERARRVHPIPPDAAGPVHVIAGRPGEPVACAVPALPARPAR